MEQCEDAAKGNGSSSRVGEDAAQGKGSGGSSRVGFGGLSRRGGKALKAFSPYMQAGNDVKAQQWSPANVEGYFLMATAESVLSFDLIHEKMRVLDLFFFATCDAHDSCLIPAPYFPAFDNDMEIRNEVEPIPVQLADTKTYIPTAAEMEVAAVAAEKKGTNPRILLVTNPSNPLGTLYPELTLKELLVWALNRGLHVLCDEIYANSKFGASLVEFISMEKVASIAVSEKLVSQQIVAQRVHTVYGMSKDFGMSGFRVGCIHTRNKDIQRFWQNMGMFAAVSNDTQHALSIMLEDEGFVDSYLAENNRRLKISYELFTSTLKSANIPYMPACAALFCWLDLRKLLAEPTFQAEDVLWREIRDKCHIILTPGNACHYSEPGFFRACYASMPPKHLKIAVERLASFAESKRRKRKAEDNNGNELRFQLSEYECR